MIRKSKIDDQEHSDRWLLTYADLLTLLLGFFVLMYGMSTIDSKRFGQMAKGLQGVFHGGPDQEQLNAQAFDSGAGVLKVGKLKLIQQRVRSLADSLDSADGMLPENGDPGTDALSTEITERGLIVHIRESALFESGKADLKPTARFLLDTLAVELSGLPNHLRVEGHTDSRPISTDRYPSNWELSAARASAVVRYLIEVRGFSAARLSALGFGEFRPRASNSSPIGMARNRRVDVVILTEKLSSLEPQAKVASRSAKSSSEQFVSQDRKSFPVSGPTP
jgi:chemotaxis protein MotB